MEDRDSHARGICRDVLTASTALQIICGLGFGADAQNLESVRERRKAVLPADLVAQLLELFAVEFDHFARRHTNQVIVNLPASDYLVVGLLVVEEHLLEDPGILKMGQSTIDSGAGDAVAHIFEL